MIDFPREPNPGEKLDASWGARVVRALRALFPMPGPGIDVSTGPTGTTISAAAAASRIASGGSACDLYIARVTGEPYGDGSLPCLVSPASGGAGAATSEALLLRPDLKRMGTVMQGTAVLAHRVSVRFSEGTEADHPEPVAGEEV